MMCKNCGAYMLDDATVCPGCGAVVEKAPEGPSILAKISLALMILSAVCSAIAVIPLAWCIPMILHYHKSMKNGTPVSLGFKVCVLIFVNTLAGILMICDNK